MFTTISHDDHGNTIEELRDTTGRVHQRTVTAQDGSVTNTATGGSVGIQSAGSVGNRVIRR